MSNSIPIFILGATGYIGGCILSRLLAHPEHETFAITAFVRSAEKSEKLKSFGINVVQGSTDDREKVEVLASQAHVVFSTASSNDVPAIQAVIAGLKKRHESTGIMPILVHTSGAQVINDQAKGMYRSDTIYDDMNPDQIEALPPNQPHRPVDIKVKEADIEGHLKSYIVIPGTVYGIVSSALVDAGIQNPYSKQIPMTIKASVVRGQVPMVGKGLCVWTSVDIDELADFYIILFNSIRKDNNRVGHGREGYFFTDSGEYSLYEFSRTIGDALVRLGVLKDPEPTAMSDEELIKYVGSVERGNKVGANARCRGNRSRALGWTPVKTTDDMLKSIFPQAQATLQTLSK
ncbi:hypothetical protein QCA50_017976 [Cerrena zonata]|uniref:NmrA-like domain-containing protein n=1 Tax=Cerrena zonata TaxID=2478898 RepID=A0AAW0FP17_9APHY